MTIYIDADACPVKQEIYRAAKRHSLKGTDLMVYVVTNSPIAVPRESSAPAWMRRTIGSRSARALALS
jgi:uncharacterized protein